MMMNNQRTRWETGRDIMRKHAIAARQLNATRLNRPLGMTALGLCMLALAGCQSARLDTVSTQPAPLPAAPAGTVQSGTLPPPGTAGVTDPSQFPTAPVNPNAPVTEPGTQTAGLEPPANAAPVNRDALVGAWKVTTAGSSCQMFMALTQWSGGFRAASRGCPGDAASVSAWDVTGSQVVLKDSSGNIVARLFASGASRYDGTTSSGQPISLSR
jgi:Protease inhibitor Inh